MLARPFPSVLSDPTVCPFTVNSMGVFATPLVKMTSLWLSTAAARSPLPPRWIIASSGKRCFRAQPLSPSSIETPPTTQQRPVRDEPSRALDTFQEHTSYKCIGHDGN